MKPALLALDFDGVVCDGIAEMVESSWRTVKELTGSAPSLGSELRARFAALRPAIESGWEMVALVGVLTETDPGQDAALRNGPAWVAARDAYLAGHGLTSGGLATAFDATRVRWIEQDGRSWLEAHRFYPGIGAWLNQLQADGQLVYILSTKSKQFLDTLLGWQNVSLPSDRVIGRAVPRRDKWDVLRDLATQHDVAPSDLWFVEDRLATLLEMRHAAPDFAARLFFADWGYVFPDVDVPAANQVGIPVLTLERMTGPFEAWLADAR